MHHHSQRTCGKVAQGTTENRLSCDSYLISKNTSGKASTSYACDANLYSWAVSCQGLAVGKKRAQQKLQNSSWKAHPLPIQRHELINKHGNRQTYISDLGKHTLALATQPDPPAKLLHSATICEHGAFCYLGTFHMRELHPQ
jgi:hypothetical protein